MTLTINWLQAIDGTNALAATIRYSLHGFAREVTPADAGSVAFEETAPVRKFPDYPHKRNVEGRFWLASTGQHVPFESFWERAFLMSLDRTRSAEAVSSQPMWIHWRNPKRRHAPDYFVRRKDGTALLVDVRERSEIEPEDAAKFELTRRMAAALGWDYLVFDDLPGATQQNLRFLLRYRDPQWLEGVALRNLPDSGAIRLVDLVALLDDAPNSALGAAYALIWSDIARCDLSRPLSMSAVVRFGPDR